MNHSKRHILMHSCFICAELFLISWSITWKASNLLNNPSNLPVKFLISSCSLAFPPASRPSSEKHGDSGRRHPALWGCKCRTGDFAKVQGPGCSLGLSWRPPPPPPQHITVNPESFVCPCCAWSHHCPPPQPPLSSRVWGKCPSSPHTYSISE